MNDTTVIGAAGRSRTSGPTWPRCGPGSATCPPTRSRTSRPGWRPTSPSARPSRAGRWGACSASPRRTPPSCGPLPGCPRASTWWCRMPCRASRGPTAWCATRTSSWPGIRGCASCDRPGGWPGAPSPAGCRRGARHRPHPAAPPLVGAALSMWLGLVLRRREPLGTGASGGAGGAEHARRRAAAADAGVLHVRVVGLLRRGRDAGAGLPVCRVVANGEPVQNLYAYDAAGQPARRRARVRPVTGAPLVVGLDAAAGAAATRTCRARAEDGMPDVARSTSSRCGWPGHDPWRLRSSAGPRRWPLPPARRGHGHGSGADPVSRRRAPSTVAEPRHPARRRAPASTP